MLTAPKTRQKFREAYAIHLAALLERNEKQALLAKQSQRLLTLLDDTPIVPGEAPRPFEGGDQGRAILNDAEAELRDWTPSWESHATDVAGQQNLDTYHDASAGNIQNAPSAHLGSETYAESNAATVGTHGGAVGAEQRMLEEERV
jgi:hypothetical protein